ncbi:TetR/AcrR family transcriptional regulator [Amycolatopsis sp. lyj-346]|uniref:TetR/AcrR family transcriptional regulator n=1 Tax=Amycolatopsis sp. lyj-346 TaxID=2789289 RepID=UPI00397D54F1
MAVEDHYQRTAATKRFRTRSSIFKVARVLFEQRGWQGTRLEDVAKEAGVSVATLRNHFKTKQMLIMHVYGTVAMMVVEEAKRLLNQNVQAPDILKLQIAVLARYAVEHRNLTAAVLVAMQDQSLEWPELTEDDLPEDYGLYAVIQCFADLIEIGQEDGLIDSQLPAFEVATYHVMALMYVVSMNSELTGDEAVALAQGQLLPTLKVND